MADKNYIEYLKNKIVSMYNPERIILFGSYAYGSPDKNSDIDLLVIFKTDLPKHKRLAGLWAHLENYTTPIDLLAYTPEEVDYWNGVSNHIITEIFKKGMVIYEKGN